MELKAVCPFPKLRFTSGFKRDLTKTLLIMKLTAILLLLACLTAAAKGYSQITLSEKNAPLQKVFKEIQKQSGYDFFYAYELIERSGTVTIKVNNVSLETAVQECLKGKGLVFDIVNRTVVIKKAKAVELLPGKEIQAFRKREAGSHR